MNSPPRYGSPAPSTPSSMSSDERDVVMSAAPSASAALSPQSSQAAKRRGPPLSAGSSASAVARERDVRARKRDEYSSSRRVGGPSAPGMWMEGGSSAAASSRAKEELLDVAIMEQLRRDFGDPFDDSKIKQAS